MRLVLPLALFAAGSAAQSTYELDLTNPLDAEYFMANTQGFWKPDMSKSATHVVMEHRGAAGVCVAAKAGIAALPAVVGGGLGFYEPTSPLLNPSNRYGTNFAVTPKKFDKDIMKTSCDNCFGLAIPYLTPDVLEISVSAFNIVDVATANSIGFSSVTGSELATLEGGAQFVGLINRVPATATGKGHKAALDVSNIGPATQTENLYLRPGLGGFQAVQYAVAPGFEWDVTRSQAYNPTATYPLTTDFAQFSFTTDLESANPVNPAASTGIADMAAAQNTIKYTFADDSSIHATVNGQEVVSAVSGQKLDRTLYGGYRPNNEANTMSVFFTEPGILGCITKIKATYNEASPTCAAWCNPYTCTHDSCTGCGPPTCHVPPSQVCDWWCNDYTTWSGRCIGC